MNTVNPTDESTPENGEAPYQLSLFVTGASVNSVRAITNLKQLCETYLPGRYALEVIDVHQQRDIAEQHQIIALPLLIKRLPLPERRLIGDMSNTEKVLQGLGLAVPFA